ncbi:hypothetical protein DS843_13625 [Roseomonas genomospecies 6]|uniref:Uncharacterized protein n=2 Tax=Roseomonas genomospecies 6 TaxID=214106 RepID=A0A9W7NJA7_9PROT|nr:hypothetical protein DS843_13625 [Roseomonas genomospecies 6]
MTEIVNRSRSVALPWSGVASSVSHFLASLRRAAPTTFKSLAEIVRKRDSRLERGDGKEPWVVAGGACLLADVALMLPRLGEQFREVEALLAGNTDQVETLEHLSRLKGEIRNGMLDAAHLLAAAQQFIEPSNLRVVAKWANLSARRGSRHKVADTPEGLSYEIECGRDEYWDNPIPRWPADVTIPDRDTILRIFA